jgi:hypothetical protein
MRRTEIGAGHYRQKITKMLEKLVELERELGTDCKPKLHRTIQRIREDLK